MLARFREGVLGLGAVREVIGKRADVACCGQPPSCLTGRVAREARPAGSLRPPPGPAPIAGRMTGFVDTTPSLCCPWRVAKVSVTEVKGDNGRKSSGTPRQGEEALLARHGHAVVRLTADARPRVMEARRQASRHSPLPL